jgi:hypothetical protein
MVYLNSADEAESNKTQHDLVKTIPVNNHLITSFIVQTSLTIQCFLQTAFLLRTGSCWVSFDSVSLTEFKYTIVRAQKVKN